MVKARQPRRPKAKWPERLTETELTKVARWRQARVTFRLHEDLKLAVEYLADLDRRSVANWIEGQVLLAVRNRLNNTFSNAGKQEDDRPLHPTRFGRI